MSNQSGCTYMLVREGERMSTSSKSGSLELESLNEL